MIRVFLTGWSLDTGGAILNPVVEYLDALQPQSGSRTVTTVIVPDADMDGRPDGPCLMVVADGQEAIEQAAAVGGVSLLPPFDLSTPINSIPQAVIDDVIAVLAAHGIPFPQVEGINIAADLLDRIEAWFSKSPVGISDQYAGRWAEFA